MLRPRETVRPHQAKTIRQVMPAGQPSCRKGHAGRDVKRLWPKAQRPLGSRAQSKPAYGALERAQAGACGHAGEVSKRQCSGCWGAHHCHRAGQRQHARAAARQSAGAGRGPSECRPRIWCRCAQAQSCQAHQSGTFACGTCGTLPGALLAPCKAPHMTAVITRKKVERIVPVRLTPSASISTSSASPKVPPLVLQGRERQRRRWGTCLDTWRVHLSHTSGLLQDHLGF